MPPAPPTFSTITCWPRISDSRAATIRPMMSAPPPAANGTTMVMGRLGQLCAAAGAWAATQAKTDAAAMLMKLRLSIMSGSRLEHGPYENRPFRPWSLLKFVQAKGSVGKCRIERHSFPGRSAARKRRTADPGSFQTPSPERSRVCSASLKKCCAAPGTCATAGTCRRTPAGSALIQAAPTRRSRPGSCRRRYRRRSRTGGWRRPRP
jgi:hypothetical protein